MGVTDLFAGEITTELLKQLFSIARKTSLCRSSAVKLYQYVEQLEPIIEEIRRTGVELPQARQRQFSQLSDTLKRGLDLSRKVLASRRWNMYKNLQLARKMERLEKNVANFMQGLMPAHVLADVHHLRFDSQERFDRIDRSTRSLERQLELWSLKLRDGNDEERKGSEEEILEGMCEGSFESFGVAVEVGVRKVREILMDREDGVVGICGIGGSGKTTLARQLRRDDQIQSYFSNRILFLTVSRSPNVDELRSKICRFLSQTEYMDVNPVADQWNLQCASTFRGSRALVILDDVWSLSELDKLLFRVPNCRTLVVSRFNFRTVFNHVYEMELLNVDEAMALFCHSAFGQKSIPVSADEQLVKQLVRECKGLPLALKVIGASLRGQPPLIWTSAKSRLSRGEPIGESHEVGLLEQMKTSISYLSDKVRECFWDLASFPEDQKIPLEVLINIWVEIHDLSEEDAIHILFELSEKNLLTLEKDSRSGETYCSYHTLFVTLHDVLRDVALSESNSGKVNQRRRLLLGTREARLPRDWERNADKPFHAQIVSLHTDEMKESDWFAMEFPKAEVLVLNFSSGGYFLPPFINTMPRLRVLIVINHGTSHAVLHNFSICANVPNLRCLWLERISVSDLPKNTIPFEKLQKMSLILCKIETGFKPSAIDFPWVFPNLSELTIDHCTDLIELPISICLLRSLVKLSVTNCHSLKELPADLGILDTLEILRIYACPSLKFLPPGLCQLVWLKYLDVSQCVNLASLPENIGRLMRLEKLDMRECPQLKTIPNSAQCLQSLKHVICDEEISWMWKEVGVAISELWIQVAEESFDLDWLKE